MSKSWSSEFLITLHTLGIETEYTDTGYDRCTRLLTSVIDQVMRQSYDTFVKPEQDEMRVEFEIYDSDGTLSADIWLALVGTKKGGLSKPKLREAFQVALTPMIDIAEVRLEKKLISQCKIETECEVNEVSEIIIFTAISFRRVNFLEFTRKKSVHCIFSKQVYMRKLYNLGDSDDFGVGVKCFLKLQ